VAEREVERVAVTGRVEPVIHRVGKEETTRHQRSRIDKGNQRGASSNRKICISWVNGLHLLPTVPQRNRLGSLAGPRW